jgi:23S rRNA (cytidine1920-2'-O)/16S rRNA (cytidine1409-2'-O)-methyltransferase
MKAAAILEQTSRDMQVLTYQKELDDLKLMILRLDQFVVQFSQLQSKWMFSFLFIKFCANRATYFPSQLHAGVGQVVNVGIGSGASNSQELDKDTIRLLQLTTEDFKKIDLSLVHKACNLLGSCDALDAFDIDVTGLVALDAGASTGGFSDVMLRRGITHIYCVDVGYGQLAWKVSQDPKVTVMDRTNIRYLTPELLGTTVDLIVADLSFISLETVLPALVSVLKPTGQALLMVKPQFEVGKEALGPGGVVEDNEQRIAAVNKIAGKAYSLGLGTAGVVASPLPGPSGNVEYFLWLKPGGPAPQESDVQRAVQEGPQ